MGFVHREAAAVAIVGCLIGAGSARGFAPDAAFGDLVKPFFETHCVECHGPDKQKAKFTVHDLEGPPAEGKDVERWEKILEMVSLGDMPPEEEPQPDKMVRSQVMSWIGSGLEGIGRGVNEDKLALPSQANRVDHTELFSGEHKGPAYSPARLWRVSPQIYRQFSKEVRTEVSQPLLGLGGKGFQDYASLLADEAVIKTMMRNSGLVAASLLEGDRARMGYVLKADDEKRDETYERAIGELFRIIFQREPTESDRARYIDGLFRKNLELGGPAIAFKTLITGMLMSQEFVFRMEIGLGEELPDGRCMLSPLELAYALSYAIYDEPDTDLLKAANEGRLTTREDVQREVRAVLAREDGKGNYWHYPMYHRWGGDYYDHQPRVLRFFQEFFGYDAAPDVFKDKERNPEHHALRLRKDADLFVLSVLEEDRDVLATLLTSNRYAIDHFREDRMEKLLKGSNEKMKEHMRNKYGDEFAKIAEAGKWPGLDSSHVTAYNLDRKKADTIRRGPDELVELPADQRSGMLTHPAWLVAHSGNFDNDIVRRGKWIREHLLADMVPEVPIGVDAKVPEDHHRTLRERMTVVEREECWRCHRKMNPLGNAFEYYDDFGRYRDRIVIGDADAYFKDLRNYNNQVERTTQDLEKWLSLDAEGRAGKVREAEERIAALKKPTGDEEYVKAAEVRYEKDMARWTKEREYWKSMTEEKRQAEIEKQRKRLGSLTPPVAEERPVDASGELRGTGDASLDGPFDDPVELTQRLARSELARQSFVRHAFRYWMGRNENLDDSPTLMDADRAYVENDGSFRELLVSLLTSDSFLYRK
ncbi:DUF1588 domain-containing protein [Haloferula helveola]|uniref:DUF1588 domain-containing protein n=1 Tax=Haloferula helveola TaxID=490095 RepID=UPI0030D4D5B3